MANLVVIVLWAIRAKQAFVYQTAVSLPVQGVTSVMVAVTLVGVAMVKFVTATTNVWKAALVRMFVGLQNAVRFVVLLVVAITVHVGKAWFATLARVLTTAYASQTVARMPVM